MGAVCGGAVIRGVALADAFFDAEGLDFWVDVEGGWGFVNRDFELSDLVVYGEFDGGFEVLALDLEAVFALAFDFDFSGVVIINFGTRGWFIEPFGEVFVDVGIEFLFVEFDGDFAAVFVGNSDVFEEGDFDGGFGVEVQPVEVVDKFDVPIVAVYWVFESDFLVQFGEDLVFLGFEVGGGDGWFDAFGFDNDVGGLEVCGGLFEVTEEFLFVDFDAGGFGDDFDFVGFNNKMGGFWGEGGELEFLIEGGEGVLGLEVFDRDFGELVLEMNSVVLFEVGGLLGGDLGFVLFEVEFGKEKNAEGKGC